MRPDNSFKGTPLRGTREANKADIPAMHRVRLAVRENALSDPTRITESDYLAALDTLGEPGL